MNYGIVLAAGKGSRMMTDVPKCAVPILGKPMISYVVDNLKNTLLDEVICVVGYKKDYIYDVLKDTVTYRVQEKQLGNAHAVKCCNGINEDGYTVIINGDSPLIGHSIIQGLVNQHVSEGNALTIGTTFLDNPYGYGRIIREDNRIIDIVEESELKSDISSHKEINCGILCVQTRILFEALDKVDNNNNKNEYYLTDIVKILKDYKIGSHYISDNYKIAGVNNLLDLYNVEQLIKKDIIRYHLANGVRIIGDCIIGPDVDIARGTVIRSSSILGNTIIHKDNIIVNSEVVDSVIFDNSDIKYSSITESTIGKGCHIGPFANIHNNSMVSGDNRIGNFVELKNTRVGASTKLSHLAYMGDTVCGSNVNFGCGSITVNYDGRRKHKTIIGDNAFIGCNTNLIAPINIDSNSFVAAGSTITQDLDRGDFAIARSKEVIKKGYASKYENE